MPLPASQSYVAFLRAINVAGHARVKMADLKRAFSAAGCHEVRTYIQSGNVLFEAPDKDTTILFQRIQVNLNELLGTEATVMFRMLPYLERMVEDDPFKDVGGESDVKLFVSFLAGRPQNSPQLPLVSSKEAVELVKMDSLEVFVVSRKKPNGMYGFPNNFVEKEFDVPATTRSWTTLTRIVHPVA